MNFDNGEIVRHGDFVEIIWRGEFPSHNMLHKSSFDGVRIFKKDEGYSVRVMYGGAPYFWEFKTLRQCTETELLLEVMTYLRG
jgi:hypothetical protein